MVYQHAGCRDCTLLSYAIQSLQGYPGELVQSSGTDITLDDVLTILDEHYNNVKALDALNQELFQLRMVDKETVSDWDVCLSRHLQVLDASFLDHFLPDWVAELKRDHFYGRLPKWLEVMVAYLKVGLQVRTYPDYLKATQEAEKEDSMELPRGPRTQATYTPSKPRATISSKWGNSRATSQSQNASSAFSAFGGRGCWQWWRPREWQPWQNWRSYRRVYGMLGKGHKRCPSWWEVLLPL